MEVRSLTLVQDYDLRTGAGKAERIPFLHTR